ncbi:hypothetical protein L6452_41612 [Arctium lappa]|uniref:Uncharacterized protein n=1 Tax=Arctium lappa TaxID=4217 RepID=A0ACB8XPT9_ARCLA|nr:hypothetical protein L6452_41612 [Arctium lappa]
MIWAHLSWVWASKVKSPSPAGVIKKKWRESFHYTIPLYSSEDLDFRSTIHSPANHLRRLHFNYTHYLRHFDFVCII